MTASASALRFCQRSMSNSSRRSLLRPDRVAKRNQTGAFESQKTSATAKFRSRVGRDRSLPTSSENVMKEALSNVEASSESSKNVFVSGGRLKRVKSQPTSENPIYEVNRIKGRIIRNDERKGSGGSLAVQMSATARHRLSRMKNEDSVIVSNPSQMSIPILEEQINKSSEDKQHSEHFEAKEEAKNDVTPSRGSSFGKKCVVFIAGASAGLSLSYVFV